MRLQKSTTLLILISLAALAFLQPKTAATHLNIEPHNQNIEPKLTTSKAIKLIGIEVGTTNQAETNPATAKIPALYGRYYQDHIAEKTPHKKKDGSMLGVYTNYESDHTGAYTLVIGLEVTSLESIPAGLTGITIPAAKYLIFPARGPMPKALIETWTHIWNYFPGHPNHPRAYTTDYEIHRSDDSADIYIAVK
jgi:predicted transcriptional regulator YdeE